MRKLFSSIFAASLCLTLNQGFARNPVSDELGGYKINVTTEPQTARIFVNGVEAGSGSVVVSVGKNDCVTVKVVQEGYVTDTRTYCDKKGMNPPPKSAFIQLVGDESYSSSVQSDVANNEILLSVKKGKSREEAWKTILQTVLSKFDVLENNDEKSGYLRTAWVGVSFNRGNNTIRTRVIIKLSSEDPLAFKIKFVSEESQRAGTAFSADELYRPFGRILKKYDGFIDELTTKLAN